jgi:hypothetical protein
VRACGRRFWLVFPVFALWVTRVDAQGLVIFNNRVLNEVEAPVYGPDPHNPAIAQVGNGQVYNGAALAGAGFTAQLFGGPTNVPVKSLSALEPATVFRTSDGAGFVVAPSRAVAVPDVPEGDHAKVQLRAWDNRGGSVTNWEQVLADPMVSRGESLPIVTPPLGSVFIAPPNLTGLQSFSLALPITLSSLTRRVDGQFQFNYINPTGMPYCIQASEDLTRWAMMGSITPGTGTFVDPSAVNRSRRFYRVVPCS